MKVTFRFVIVLLLMSIITWFLSELIFDILVATVPMTSFGELSTWIVWHLIAFSLSVYAAVISLEEE